MKLNFEQQLIGRRVALNPGFQQALDLAAIPKEVHPVVMSVMRFIGDVRSVLCLAFPVAEEGACPVGRGVVRGHDGVRFWDNKGYRLSTFFPNPYFIRINGDNRTILQLIMIFFEYEQTDLALSPHRKVDNTNNATMGFSL